MKRFLLLLFLASLVIPGARSTSVYAQTNPVWLQVWGILGQGSTSFTLEYRDAAGNVLASYTLSGSDFGFGWQTHQKGGRLFGSSTSSFPIFDPYTGNVIYDPIAGKQTDTNQVFYNTSVAVPAPDGQVYAYGVTPMYNDFSSPTTSSIYVASPGQNDARLLFQQPMAEGYLSLEPLGWSDDGSILLLHEMPTGIGGYILFWQYQNVQAYNLSSGAAVPVGDVDGYSGNAQLFAAVQRSDTVQGLQVTNIATQQVTNYPLPNLGETVYFGGGAFFSPSATKVAYQVARGDPENEKFWTIVVDLQTGQSQVVLQDQFTDYQGVYGYIGGWLDDSTLAVGQTDAKTALINVANGTLLREARGGFLGYANGITDTTGFAASASVQRICPGAPPSRLEIGGRGRVTFTDGTPVRVRQSPGGTQTDTQPEGAVFDVLNGPTCQGSYAWWEVRFDSGVYGFVAEGDLNSYYLEPWK
jgi:hypothetical protein